MNNESPMLRHVVMFAFKPTTTPERIAEIEQAFAALPDEIDEIIDFEWGTDVSVENRSQGFTHCFIVSFASTEARDRYLPHPAHQRFVQLVSQEREKVLVVDFWKR